MKRALRIIGPASLVGAAFVAVTAFAGEPGFYIGVSGGETTMEAESGPLDVGPVVNPLEIRNFDLDGEESGFKIYAGYNFVPWFGIEGGYVELGNVSSDFPEIDTLAGPVNVDAELDVGGVEGFLVGTLPLGNFDIFAKVGGFSGDVELDGEINFPNNESTHFSGDTEDSDVILAYGAGVAWNFGHWALRAEYEEYDADGIDELYFVSAGVVYRFFEDAAPAAPPPKPAPVVAAAPAKCPDGDGDGVCDSSDSCPNTPAGARVGPRGCDCDYTLRTHFAFDSAELTDEDKVALDELAEILTQPEMGFVAGEVHGHTDNVGEEAYNQDLSRRRAENVANYLESKGVERSGNFEIKGMGESDPIADNSTEDGRTQNRRVTIHRTDCGPAN